MNTKQILIVSKAKFDGLLSKEPDANFKTTFAKTDEEAIEMANRQRFDMVVIGHSSAEIDTKKLSAVLPILQPEVDILCYQGESDNELEQKVKAVFYKKRAERLKRFLVLDSSASIGWNNLPFSAN